MVAYATYWIIYLRDVKLLRPKAECFTRAVVKNASMSMDA